MGLGVGVGCKVAVGGKVGEARLAVGELSTGNTVGVGAGKEVEVASGVGFIPQAAINWLPARPPNPAATRRRKSRRERELFRCLADMNFSFGVMGRNNNLLNYTRQCPPKSGDFGLPRPSQRRLADKVHCTFSPGKAHFCPVSQPDLVHFWRESAMHLTLLKPCSDAVTDLPPALTSDKLNIPSTGK
jgi:hypothetical protein